MTDSATVFWDKIVVFSGAQKPVVAKNNDTIVLVDEQPAHHFENSPVAESMKTPKVHYQEMMVTPRRKHLQLYANSARRARYTDCSRQPRDKGHEKNWRRRYAAVKDLFQPSLI